MVWWRIFRREFCDLLAFVSVRVELWDITWLTSMYSVSCSSRLACHLMYVVTLANSVTSKNNESVNNQMYQPELEL